MLPAEGRHIPNAADRAEYYCYFYVLTVNHTLSCQDVVTKLPFQRFPLLLNVVFDFDLAGVLVLGLGIGIVPQGPRQVTAVFLLFYPLLDWRSRIFLALSTTPLRMLSSEMYAVWAYIIR